MLKRFFATLYLFSSKKQKSKPKDEFVLRLHGGLEALGRNLYSGFSGS